MGVIKKRHDVQIKIEKLEITYNMYIKNSSHKALMIPFGTIKLFFQMLKLLKILYLF